VFENRVLRGISGSKRDEITGGWRKFHSEKLHNSYSYEDEIDVRITYGREAK
jgi:hypothetical protein